VRFCGVFLGVGVSHPAAIDDGGKGLSLPIWCCALAIGAQSVCAAPAATLTQRLVADARDGQLDEFGFFTAALIASGVDDERELTGWLDIYTARRHAVIGAVSRMPIEIGLKRSTPRYMTRS